MNDTHLTACLQDKHLEAVWGWGQRGSGAKILSKKKPAEALAAIPQMFQASELLIHCWDQQDLEGAQDLVEQNCANLQDRVILYPGKEKQRVFKKPKVSSFCYCTLAILQWYLKDVEMMIKACHISTEVRSEHLWVCCCSPGLVAFRGSPKADKKSQVAIRDHLEELESPAWAESTISCRNTTVFRIATAAWLWSLHPEQEPVAKGWKKSAFHYIFTCKWGSMTVSKPWFQQQTRDLWITAAGCIPAILTCKSSRPT